MAIQNSINTVLGTVAAGVAGVSHLAEIEKSNQMNAANLSESMPTKLVDLANQGTKATKDYDEKHEDLSKAGEAISKAEDSLYAFNAEKKHRDKKGKFMSKEQSDQKRIVLQHDLYKAQKAWDVAENERLAKGQQLQVWKARWEAFNKTDALLKNQRGYTSPDRSALLTPEQTYNINKALKSAETSKKENGIYNKYVNEDINGGKK